MTIKTDLPNYMSGAASTGYTPLLDMIDGPQKEKKTPEYLKPLEPNGGELKNYTIIYKDGGELFEAWHYINYEYSINFINHKYKKSGKEIIEIKEKTLPFGQYVKTLKGANDE